MVDSESKEYLDARGTITIIILTAFWGFNFTAIKFLNLGIAPVFASTLRSVIASICGLIYCWSKRETPFHTDIRLFHGLMVGLLFGAEFVCVFLGLLYTDAARSVVFVNTSPFVVAIGAHLFIKDDRLTFLKILGLVLAFLGVVLIFQGKPKAAGSTMIIGDILEIMGAIFWGATTVYIKRFMAGKVHPINTFLYQLIFSIPLLFVMSLILEKQWIYRLDFPIVVNLLYQSVGIAFLSYFIFFRLIHKYSVSRLAAFTFLAPIFGVLYGVVFLNEELTRSLMIGLPLVCLGIFLVNWRRSRA